jgi:hypothetical protein
VSVTVFGWEAWPGFDICIRAAELTFEIPLGDETVMLSNTHSTQFDRNSTTNAILSASVSAANAATALVASLNTNRPASSSIAADGVRDNRTPQPTTTSFAPQPAGVPRPANPGLGNSFAPQPAGVPRPANPGSGVGLRPRAPISFAEQENNNTREKALANNNIGNLSSRTAIATGATSRNDTVDIYAFSLAKDGNVNFNLSEMSKQLNLKLMDATGNVVLQDVQSGTQAKQFQKSLAAGDYYVKVWNGSNQHGSSYQLTIADATPPTPVPQTPGAPAPRPPVVPAPQPSRPNPAATRQFIEVNIERVRAIDDFDPKVSIGGYANRSYMADFYAKVQIGSDSEWQKSQVYQDQNVVNNMFVANRVMSNTRDGIVPIKIALYDQDALIDDQADINPALGHSGLHLDFNTRTGEITGNGVRSRREGDLIIVSGALDGAGRKDQGNSRAEIAFRITRQPLV